MRLRHDDGVRTEVGVLHREQDAILQTPLTSGLAPQALQARNLNRGGRKLTQPKKQQHAIDEGHQ